MKNHADEIRKRMAKRKRERQQMVKQSKKEQSFLVHEEEKYGGDLFPAYTGQSEDGHPLFRKELIMFKTLFSIILVLVVAILFKNPSPKLESARSIVKGTMESDFQFAAISDWYEKNFGSPLAIFPLDQKEKKANPSDHQQYAVPASGKILEDFEANGQGIMIETGSNSSVEAMSEGIVNFIGQKDDLGKTVIIQHADGSESWYGHLEEISVNLYDFVDKGKEVGKVMDNEKGKGTFYFAIKKGEHFIDPIQVISFE
jgi:stage IV sporulation protein FA